MLRATPGWRRMKAGSFEGENHLVDRGWADAEMALDVGFGGRASEHARIGVYEGQILGPAFR